MSESMDLQNIILIITVIFDLFFLAFVLLNNVKSEANISYALFVLWVAIWGLGVAMFRYLVDVEQLLFWNRTFIIAAGLIASGILHFSLVFSPPEERKFLPNYKRFLIYLPNIFIILATFTPGVLIAGIYLRSWGHESVLGWGYKYYALYFIVMSSLALWHIAKKYFTASGVFKKQSAFAFFGLVLAFSFGAIFNLFLILVGNYRYIWVGPYSSFIMLAFIGYAIVKHQWLNIKTVSAAIFAGVLNILFFAQLFFPINSSDFIFRAIVFIATLFFSILLVRGVMKEVRDREEIERLAKDLEKANADLVRLDKAKSEFISIASHQLRTPLSIIKGYISLIREGSYGTISDDVAKTLNKIYLSNERLIKLVNDLLDLSRMESGKLRYEFSDTDIKSLVSSIVDEFQIPAYDKGIKILWHDPEGAIPLIWADGWKLRQVIFNLLDNALKYTNAGTIEISLEQESNGIKLGVKDSGVGMSKETLGMVFHKFARGREGVRIDTGGVGLGLYIAKRIIDDHHGELWPESQGEGKGSTFFVRLPYGTSQRVSQQLSEFMEKV